MIFKKRPSNKIPANPEPNTLSEEDYEVAVEEIEASGLFDSKWYLQQYPDVAQAGINPVVHYVMAGASEGRLPGPQFDVMWYLGETPEAATPGMNPILHYLRKGRAQDQTPKALDEGQAFDSFLATTRAGRLPFADAVRAGIDHVHYQADPIQPQLDRNALHLPPLELSIRIGSPTLNEFEEIGIGVKQTITRCLPEGFDFRGTRCLDFGCGSVE